MKRALLCTAALVSLIACDDPMRPRDPTATVSPPAPAVAAEDGFTVRRLGTLGGPNSFAFNINERTEVVGEADLPSGQLRAFLWTAARGMRSLGTLGGNSSAGSNNDRGDVVGISEIRPGSDVVRAFLWTPGRGMQSLGTFRGANTAASSINNRRQVVGGLPDVVGPAFLWEPGRGMRSLGTLGGPNSFAQDINDATQVVGSAETRSGAEHAFLWEPGRGMRDLGTLGGTNSFAVGISQTG